MGGSGSQGEASLTQPSSGAREWKTTTRRDKVTEKVPTDRPLAWQGPGSRPTLLDVGENNLRDAKDLGFGPNLPRKILVE